MKILKVKNISKVYETYFGKYKYPALKDVSFEVEKGGYVAVMGESGSGKTTLLNIIAGLDASTSGSVEINGQELSKIKDSKLAVFRRESLGFVFQDCNLLDIFSVKDNIMLPLVLAKEKHGKMVERMNELAKKLDIQDIIEKYPYEISGGQKQRAAVARAMMVNPKILLADEPTGALDSKAASNLLDMFDIINREGQTIIMVTHSIKAACRAKRIIFLKDGVLMDQLERREKMTNDEMNEQITSYLSHNGMLR